MRSWWTRSTTRLSPTTASFPLVERIDERAHRRRVILGGHGRMFSSGHDLGTPEARAEYAEENRHPSFTGNGATRVIQIGAAASADISGLTITAGRADTGGGISTADGTFTVTRCTFDGNQATGPIGKGGAIYTKNGSVIVIGCTFSGNSADQSGGGIHSEAINSPRPTILSVADSSFLSNLAVGGGGISTVYPSTFSTCTVTNTTFDANRASSFGGAINGGGTIAGCTFVGNTAGQTAGAICCRRAGLGAVNSAINQPILLRFLGWHLCCQMCW